MAYFRCIGTAAVKPASFEIKYEAYAPGTYVVEESGLYLISSIGTYNHASSITTTSSNPELYSNSWSGAGVKVIKLKVNDEVTFTSGTNLINNVVLIKNVDFSNVEYTFAQDGTITYTTPSVGKYFIFSGTHEDNGPVDASVITSGETRVSINSNTLVRFTSCTDTANFISIYGYHGGQPVIFCMKIIDKSTPSPSNYDYFIENVSLTNNNFIDTQIPIFSADNINRDWQIDFKMSTSASGEKPYIGTSQRSGKTIELYLDNNGTHLYIEDGGFPDSPLAAPIEDKNVTITMISNVITIKADGDIVIQKTVNQKTGTNTLLIGKYVGGNTYHYNGYCDYFGFKWLT